jgi:hypothetical protein
LRLAACLLLAAIGGDLLADACDLPFIPAAVVAVSATGTDSEPCASVCVPDCFCCSQSTCAGPSVEAPAPGALLTLLAPTAGEPWPDGVRPVVDRPPLRA